MATKARRNTLGKERSAWQLHESNFEVETALARKEKALELAAQEVRRASVLEDTSGRRGSVAIAFDAVKAAEAALLEDEPKYKPPAQNSIPFDQSSAVYGRGSFADSEWAT